MTTARTTPGPPSFASVAARYALARVGLLAAVAGLLLLADVPLLIALLVALIVALPLSMVLFRGLRAQLDAVLTERATQRAALRARLRGETGEGTPGPGQVKDPGPAEGRPADGHGPAEPGGAGGSAGQRSGQCEPDAGGG